MHNKTKFLVLILLFSLFSIGVVSASDINGTDVVNVDDINGSDVVSVEDNSALATDNNNTQSDGVIVKEKPKISVGSKNIYTKDSLNINLKDSKGNALESKKLTFEINNKTRTIKTDSDGVASYNVNLPAGKYTVKISFKGDKNFKDFNKSFTIKVSKLKTKISSYTNLIVKGTHLYFYLTDINDNPVSSKQVTIKLNGKTYNKKTNSRGRAGVKINLYSSKYSINARFDGDDYYKSSFKKLSFYVTPYTSLTIGNSKLLSKGCLRIYLKDSTRSAVTKKTITIKIGGKTFTKKTNSEGIVIVKPKLAAKNYYLIVKMGKYQVSKRIPCIEGNVKDSLEENISMKNGLPDIDVMPACYVMGDGSATYTLKKAQYREVIKRDSYCLFLNNKLTKYTFFKTKSHPSTYHILKREKWNVIERAINKKIVAANKNNYWPGEITVSLKGKSYTYSEVRDIQGTSYTCGPTSASVCSQVLRNYVCEKVLAKQAGTNKSYGTKCSGIKTALEKNHFNCTYFYADSFDDALDELKKGGCALVFHTKRHYVAVLDISKNGKKVLVSNSYGSYYNIPTKWLTVSYMKTRFVEWDDSLIVRLNYHLSQKTKDSVNAFYNSMGSGWTRQNTHENILK